jgi:hypothetical protein
VRQAPAPRLAPGLEARYERVVPQKWVIAYYDPILPAVFSTPAMTGMMEMASVFAALVEHAHFVATP